MHEIEHNTFRNQQRLRHRLQIGKTMLCATAAAEFTEYHLYILRVCELLILSCLKPQVDRVVRQQTMLI